MRIVVTGGSGKAGRWVVRDLREQGHDVLNVDTKHDGSPHGQCLLADLADYGQTAEALAGFDAVVHLAAIPAPGLRPPADTFRNNILSTYNVFAAAEANGLSGWSGRRARRSSGCRSTPRPSSRRSTRPSSRVRRPRTPSRS